MGRTAEQTNDCALRLDMWLYRTRLAKSRTQAGGLIARGKVRIDRNGTMERTRKSHRLVRSGDRITFMRGQTLIYVEVCGMPSRRGPAAEAQEFYTACENVPRGCSQRS